MLRLQVICCITVYLAIPLILCCCHYHYVVSTGEAVFQMASLVTKRDKKLTPSLQKGKGRYGSSTPFHC